MRDYTDELRAQKDVRDYKNKHKHGHKFNPVTSRCPQCGLSENEYWSSKELGSDGGDRPVCSDFPAIEVVRARKLRERCYTVAYAMRNL